MNDTLRGMLKSKMIWFNAFLAGLAAIELGGTYLTQLWGVKGAAAILLTGSVVNALLRTITTQALEDK
jgi:hypothetical protein